MAEQAPGTDETGEDMGLAAKVFGNTDFGYHKVTIERPDRRKAGMSRARIAVLRFDKALISPMEWIWEQWGDTVYAPDTLITHEKEILTFCEDSGIALNLKNRKKLLNLETWKKHLRVFDAARVLLDALGHEEFDDFNRFKTLVDGQLKEKNIKLSATEKKAILNAVSWYDDTARRVIKKKIRLNEKKLGALLTHLGCHEKDLPDFGYYPVTSGKGKQKEFLTYERCPDLRDHESVPLKDEIHGYFNREVSPHVPEAWINLDSVKIGYEISFNKYFYRHKPLRSMEAVAKDILDLEQQAEGLIADILGIDVTAVSGGGHG